MWVWYKGAYGPEATILTDTAKYDDDESELVRRLWQDLGSPGWGGCAMTTRRELMTGGALALAASPLAVAQALAEHEPMVELYRQSDQLMAAPAIQAAFGTVYL